MNSYHNRMVIYGLGVAVLGCAGQVSASSDPVGVAPVQQQQTVLIQTQQPEKNYSFVLTGSAGYLTGESKEIVYWPEYGNHKASELTWEIDNLFMIGMNAKMTFGQRFEANFAGWFKATDGDGTMDDYDWQNIGGDWTDWSHHEDTDVTDGSIIDLSASYAFIKGPVFALKGIGGFKHDNFGWVAKGGDYIYSVYGYRDYTGSFSDGAQAVSYEQTMTSLYAGLGMEVTAGSFVLESRIIYAPWVSAEATDHHHMRNLVTEDDFDDGDMIAFDISASYFFTEKLGLEVGFSYQSYDTVQGDSEWRYGSAVYSYDDGAGMSQESSMLSVGVQYIF